MDKVKDIAAKRLCDTKGGEFHEDIDDLLFLWQLCDAVDIGIGKQGITIPIWVVEAQGDIIGKFHITKQEFQ